MSEYSDRLLVDGPRKDRVSKVKPAVAILVPLAAILFQVYVPLFFKYLSYLELPLLVTVYFSLVRRHQIAGTLIGAVIGLAQDSLAHHPLGMYGIVKTLVGYFSASISLRLDIENSMLRLFVGFFFFLFHESFFWLLSGALLGQDQSFDLIRTLMAAVLNAAVAVPLFAILDKLKERP